MHASIGLELGIGLIAKSSNYLLAHTQLTQKKVFATDITYRRCVKALNSVSKIVLANQLLRFFHATSICPEFDVSFSPPDRIVYASRCVPIAHLKHSHLGRARTNNAGKCAMDGQTNRLSTWQLKSNRGPALCARVRRESNFVRRTIKIPNGRPDCIAVHIIFDVVNANEHNPLYDFMT